MSKYNDINLNKWKEYDDIWVDSLWLIDKRDSSGVHNASYHGNFVPQIPNQLLKRYTKKGDTILDPFMGSGTSLIEAQRLGRNYIGIELQKEVAKETQKLLKKEPDNNVKRFIGIGDSRSYNIDKALKKIDKRSIQFIIYHPPYWDIIKFSKDKRDLSNTKTIEDFFEAFDRVVDNTTKYLDKNRYLGIVIGDKYQNGELIPLGFYTMMLFQAKGFLLKSIIVKNFGETKGKAGTQGIWRYRALANDFYIFKHEYILIFKKI